jgi:threonine synthase
MGLPINRLVIATNENDILDRFFKTSRYEKQPGHGAGTGGGVKETLSPAMDILISSNFERLLWYLAFENETSSATDIDQKRAHAGVVLKEWMAALKTTGTTAVSDAVLATAKRDFSSERVSDGQTVDTIRHIFTTPPSAPYILDPHTAVGVAAALRLVEAAKRDGEADVHFVALSTAHPAKFNRAVDLALSGVEGGEGVYDFETMVRPEEFQGLESGEKKVREVERADVDLVMKVVIEELEMEGVGKN